MKSRYLWGAALGVGLALAACGATDVEPDGSGGLGGEAGAASGGASASGGRAAGGEASGGRAAGGEASGGRAAGGAASGGLGGSGALGGTGSGPEATWPPPESALSGTLEELQAMDCVIELDEGDDGSVDQRWGVDYFEGKLARKLIWVEDGTITVVSFDENERPWLACEPDGCDRTTQPDEPVEYYECCPPEGTEEWLVERHTNPPADSPTGGWAVYWMGPEGAPEQAYTDFGPEELRSFYSDGTTAHTEVWYDEYASISQWYYPNGQLSSSDDSNFDEDYYYILSYRQACNSSGWQTEWVIDSYDKWSRDTTSYEEGGGLGGGAGVGGGTGDAVLVAYTVREEEEGWSTDVTDDIVSVIRVSEDGANYEVSYGSDASGWSGEFSVERANGRPHIVDRMFDGAGHLVSAGVDVTVDDVADSTNTYSHSVGCLPGENPQLDFIPRLREPGAGLTSCPFKPLP